MYIECKAFSGAKMSLEEAETFEAEYISCNKEGADFWNNHQRELYGNENDDEQYYINYKEGIEDYKLSYKTLKYEPIIIDS